MTLHFGDWHDASSLRDRTCAQIINSSFWCLNTKPYPVWILSRHKIYLSKQPTFRDTTTGSPANWRLRNQHRNSILTTCLYPDPCSTSGWMKQFSNQSEALTIQIWVMTRHWYGISLISQPSSRGETTIGVEKCRLFSQPSAKAVPCSVKVAQTLERSWNGQKERNVHQWDLLKLPQLQKLRKLLICNENPIFNCILGLLLQLCCFT